MMMKDDDNDDDNDGNDIFCVGLSAERLASQAGTASHTFEAVMQLQLFSYMTNHQRFISINQYQSILSPRALTSNEGR